MTIATLPPDQWSDVAAFDALLPIESERLRFRHFRDQDLDDVLRHRADPEVCRYVAPVMDREQVGELTAVRRRWTGENGHMLMLIPERKSDGLMVGELGLRIESVADSRIEIGYILQQPHYGKGYATEIARALIDFCFERLGAHKVVGRCDPENHASVSVMEKAGMTREALFRHHYLRGGRWTDTAVYSRLSPEAMG